MSRLRTNPDKHTCQNWLGVDKQKQDLGLCGDLAVIRCNACKEYFCEECWWEHLHMTIVVPAGSTLIDTVEHYEGKEVNNGMD